MSKHLSNHSDCQLSFVQKSINEAAGTVDAVISSATVDNDGESVDPNGLDTSRADDNAPLVDSHNYDGIQNQLGVVTNIRKSGGRVLATFKLAIDVPENVGAKFAFGMIRAGYLKACSVGFMPDTWVKPADGKLYDQALAKLNLPNSARPVRIITGWTLMEVSLCIIGCNPDALVAAQKAAGLSSRDLANFQALARRHSPPSTKNQSTHQTAMSRSAFLSRLDKTIGVQPALESLEQARKGQSESELLRSLGAVQRAQFAVTQRSAQGYIAELLSDPQTRFELTAECKALAKLRLNPDEAKHVSGLKQKAMTEATQPGAILMSTLLCDTVLALTPLYGAYSTLGVLPMPTGTTKFARATAEPAGVWQSRTQQGGVLTSDIIMTGASLSGQVGSLFVYIEVSDELLQDSGVDITATVLARCAAGLAGGLDNAAFAGTGADDGVSGAQTGIFPGVVTNVASAAVGNTSADKLQREDFLAQIAMVNGSALQRGCRFWTNPAFLPLLMTIKAGNAGYLVKTPLDNGGDEWSLNGFPMSLTPAAPPTLTPGSTVCAFGHGPAYNVGIREGLEFTLGVPKFNQCMHAFRAIMRARCDIVDQTWFALLNLAAQ